MREIEAKLPRDWGAYAAFRLVTRGSKLPLDIDLLLLTTNRILMVELKNWSGDIEYTYRGVATVAKVRVKKKAFLTAVKV